MAAAPRTIAAACHWRRPIGNGPQEEPLLFVGQINCGELRGLPGAEFLPASGLLAFFGGHDAVTGCSSFGDHCVFHWPDVGRQVPAKARLEPIEVFPACAFVPRPILDLPDPHSRKIRDLRLSHVQTSLYFEQCKALRWHGMPYGIQGYSGFANCSAGRRWCSRLAISTASKIMTTRASCYRSTSIATAKNCTAGSGRVAL